MEKVIERILIKQDNANIIQKYGVVCCNPECDHNCSVDDELEEMLENQLMDFL